MKPSRSIATIVACAAVTALSVAAPAFAGGKAVVGCADGGWQLAWYVTSDNVGNAPIGSVPGDLINIGGNNSGQYEARTHDGLVNGVFAAMGLDVSAILKFVDKNNDGDICYKLPSGWTQSTSNKTDLLSLADDKIVS